MATLSHPARKPRSPRTTALGGEAGSAYLTVLLVMVVLSILALSLVLVTQIESDIGTNERIVHRTFYSADSGISAAVARKMSGGSGPFRFEMNATGAGSLRRGDLVQVGNFFPVGIGFCSLSTANVGSEYHRIDYLAFSQAERFVATSPSGGDRHPIALQTVTADVAIQCEKGPSDFLGLDKKSGQRLGDVIAKSRGDQLP